jgi:G:T-mismatch repair DNA endonuclease (very short patch repair protein)
MKCLYCDYICEKANSFKKHLKYHHFNNKNSNELEISFLNIFYKINDIDIKNILKFYNEDKMSVQDVANKYNVPHSCINKVLTINNIKIRSFSDSKKTDKYINKIESTNIKKYGFKNPSSSNIVKEKRKQTFLKNLGYENNFCNHIIQKKAENNINREKSWQSNKATLLKKYGVDNMLLVPEFLEKMKKSIRKRFDAMSYEDKLKLTEKARSCIAYESKIQIRVQNIINELNVEYTANAFLWKYNFDFVFKNRKILEIQGDFWHANPLKYRGNDILLEGLLAKDVWEKDERKKIKAKQNGYEIYYLWENEINTMSDAEIKKFIIKYIIGAKW